MSRLIVKVWAMKYLPRKYRESQTDWFGKRGIQWHLTVATRREGGELQMLTSHTFSSPVLKTTAQSLLLWPMLFGS